MRNSSVKVSEVKLMLNLHKKEAEYIGSS